MTFMVKYSFLQIDRIENSIKTNKKTLFLNLKVTLYDLLQGHIFVNFVHRILKQNLFINECARKTTA